MSVWNKLLVLPSSATIRKRLIASSSVISAADLSQRQKDLMARGLPKKRRLEGVKHVILVASGKGGVGKSTAAVNLALAMSKVAKRSVGILDADIYGPSIPIMMNLDLSDSPLVDDNNKMVPLENYGIKTMSMGYLVKAGEALVWRGPMVMGAVEKMAFGTAWSPLDILVVDLPPGTGDIHLSIAQTMDVSGAVIVSTPQKVALADARKGVKMFERVNIPVFGLIENMAAFSCPNCNNVTHVFGKEHELIEGVDSLGKIPLEVEIMRMADEGTPFVISNPTSATTETFRKIATDVLSRLNF